MRSLFFSYLFLLSFSFITLFAQDDLRVESFTVNGELTAEDPISEGLGRINAVQLNFSQGDYFYSSLTADFVPMLVLVAPSGEYKISYPDKESLIATYDGRINESGQWLLYIVGDTTDTGTYTLNNKYASALSMDFDFEGDYCKNINLLLEHLEADFHFIKGNSSEENSVEFNSEIQFPGVEDAKIYGFGDEWFKAVLFIGDEKSFAEGVFTATEASITDCLDDEWTKVLKGWANVVGGDNISQKSCLFSAKDGSARYVKLVIAENFNGNEEEHHPYSVEIIINKDR